MFQNLVLSISNSGLNKERLVIISRINTLSQLTDEGLRKNGFSSFVPSLTKVSILGSQNTKKKKKERYTLLGIRRLFFFSLFTEKRFCVNLLYLYPRTGDIAWSEIWLTINHGYTEG